jgi:Undecaprenyl-phosphate glucose phosphotransferase
MTSTLDGQRIHRTAGDACGAGGIGLAVSAPSFSGAGLSAFAGDSRTVFFGAMRAADNIVVASSAVLSYWARHGSLELPTHVWWQIVIGCLVSAIALHFGQAYSFASLRRRSRHLGIVALVWTASVLTMIALVYFTKTADEISRAWMLIWAVTSLGGLLALRMACWVWLAHWRRRGIFVFEVAVVGEKGPAERLARRIEETAKGDAHVLGIFRPQATAGEPDVPGIRDLVQFSRRVRVDEIAVAIPCAGMLDLEVVLGSLSALPADIKLCLDFGNPMPRVLNATNVPTVLLSKRPLAGWRMIVKRAMDVAISSALIAFFAPLILAIAVVVKLESRGPVIFRQERFGFNKQPITVYKFRTMHAAAAADTSVPQARRRDPRITRVGHFLRRTSLDELPQFFNVLGGDMSLVGPRPHAIAHDEHYASLIDGYLARHRVKPGITGWAQANGYRGETDTIEKMKGRLEYDLFYIDHWSPLLDLRILARTALVGFRQDNAY